MNLKEILATLQTDETGWRVRGRNWWLWVIGTQDTAYFTVDKTRQTLSSLGRRHAALSAAIMVVTMCASVGIRLRIAEEP